MDDQTVNVVGYARISSADQSEDGQVDALRRAGTFRMAGLAKFERDLLRERQRGASTLRAQEGSIWDVRRS